MVKIDLQNAFIKALNRQYPTKNVLVDTLSNLIFVEKDGIYRRLSGKINFTINEMAAISSELNIPIDRLISGSGDEIVPIPFILKKPLNIPSLDILFDSIDQQLEHIRAMGRVTCGSAYRSLPIESYIHTQLFSKFMFYRLEHYFIGSGKSKSFSQWQMPERVLAMADKHKEVHRNIDSIYYIVDEFVFSTLAIEVLNFHRMQIITDSEKELICDELHSLLDSIEQVASRTALPRMIQTHNKNFYISPIPIGFDVNYFYNEEKYFTSIYTDFCFSHTKNSPEEFSRLKEWIDSFRNISTSISNSGLIERTRYFNFQRKLISQILG